MTPRRASLLVLLLAAAPGGAAAQDSQLGIQGLGTPDRWESIRARTTGGAFAAFDHAAPLTDASLGLLRRLTAYGAGTTTFRSVTLGDETASLRTSRFPVMAVAGPLGPFVIGGGFGTYLHRNFQVVRRDSVVLRGEFEPFTDDLTSSGGVGDVRFAAAWRSGNLVALGASLHFLTGLAHQTLIRRFDDSLNYRSTTQLDDIRFNGLGGAASILVLPGGALQLAGWVRADTRLEYETADTTGAYDLPLSAGAALAWRPRAQIALAAAIDWRGWSVVGANAFDTFAWSVGAELGDPGRPLRLGVRGGELPFGPGAAAPTELGVSAGLGLRFSDGRAMIDLGVERLTRSGPGLSETLWTAMVGITVRP